MDFGASLGLPELAARVRASVERGAQRQRRRDGWQMVTAGREVGWNRRQVSVRPDVQDQIHADQYVEQEVAVEQPVSCINEASTGVNFRSQPGLLMSRRDKLRRIARLSALKGRRAFLSDKTNIRL